MRAGCAGACERGGEAAHGLPWPFPQRSGREGGRGGRARELPLHVIFSRRTVYRHSAQCRPTAASVSLRTCEERSSTTADDASMSTTSDISARRCSASCVAAEARREEAGGGGCEGVSGQGGAGARMRGLRARGGAPARLRCALACAQASPPGASSA